MTAMAVKIRNLLLTLSDCFEKTVIIQVRLNRKGGNALSRFRRHCPPGVLVRRALRRRRVTLAAHDRTALIYEPR
jgi:hypothetical protein